MSLNDFGYEPTQNENNTELYKVQVIDGEQYDDNTFMSPKGTQYNLPNHPEEMAKTLENINRSMVNNGKKPIDSIKTPVMIRLNIKVVSKTDGSKSDLDGVLIKTNPIQFDFKPRKNGYKTELALLLEGAGNDIETLLETGFNLQNVLLNKDIKDVPIITATVEDKEVSWISFKDWRENQGWVNPKPKSGGNATTGFGAPTEANKAAQEFESFLNTPASDEKFN